MLNTRRPFKQLTAATADGEHNPISGVYGCPAASFGLADEYALAEERPYHVVLVRASGFCAPTPLAQPCISRASMDRTLSRDHDKPHACSVEQRRQLLRTRLAHAAASMELHAADAAHNRNVPRVTSDLSQRYGD